MEKLNETIIIWEDLEGSGVWSILGFDGVLSEEHTGSNTITSFPVDSGFKVSEHAIRQNKQINLDTIISNVSLNTAAGAQSFEEAFQILTTKVSQAGGTKGSTYNNSNLLGRPAYNNQEAEEETEEVTVSDIKIDTAFLAIVKLVEKGTLVHCLTVRGWYLDCVIRGYSISNSVKDIHCLPIQLRLEQLVVVKGNTVLKTTGVTTAADGDLVVSAYVVPPGLAEARENAKLDATLADEYEPTVDAPPVSFSLLDHRSVPFSTAHDVQFVYKNTNYTLGKLVYSITMNCYVTSLGWGNGGTQNTATGIALRSGINLVQQYNTGLPSLVAINISEPGADVTNDYTDLRLFIVEDYEEYFITGDIE